jgi:Fe-Mn family superoxide dismutase
MKFLQPKLPYVPDELSPVISQETVEVHYGIHEKIYIDNLNRLIEGTEFEDLPLESIIKQADGDIFNNASQAWNHIFYFFQFSGDGRRVPAGELLDQIEEQFDSFENFKLLFEKAGVSLFGSGWVWLASDSLGKLHIIQGSNADNPLTKNMKPILTFDVWEHAYYLDYHNQRGKYLSKLWDILDWRVLETRYY